MSLLSIDIIKVKRLSLRDVKLPPTELRVAPITSILRDVKLPPTEEEITYSKMVAINPQIEDFIECLDLVSFKTGKRVRKVELIEDIIEPEEIDRPKQTK